MRTNYWNTFNESAHLKPSIKQSDFDQLKGWDFAWLLLEPINLAKSEKHEVELAKKFSGGQKALYFFWFLETYVSHGGFLEFYWQGFDQYLPPTLLGLELIGDHEMIALLNEVEQAIDKNSKLLMPFYEEDDLGGAYEQFSQFVNFNQTYLKLRDTTIQLLETYARHHPEQFALLEQ